MTQKVIMKHIRTYEINAEGELTHVAKSLLEKFLEIKKTEGRKEAVLVSLIGELGAGKTTFVKYLLKTLAPELKINSPTFGKVHEYKTKDWNIYHMDFYRESLSFTELEEILLDPNGLVLIEWLERFDFELFFPFFSFWNLRINRTAHDESDSKRQIILERT